MRMPLSIPEDINRRSRLEVATFFRDLGFAVVPFKASKKVPLITSWPTLDVARCDDAFLNRWWGNGNSHDLGILVVAPLVIVDIDGPGDPKVALDWIRSQPHLAGAP